MSREQLQHLIQLLDLSIASFEYKGKKQMKRHHRIGAGGHASVLAAISTCASSKKTSMVSVKNQLEKSIIGTDNARTDMLMRTKQKNPIQSNLGKGTTKNRSDAIAHAFTDKSVGNSRAQQKFKSSALAKRSDALATSKYRKVRQGDLQVTDERRYETETVILIRWTRKERKDTCSTKAKARRIDCVQSDLFSPICQDK